MEWVWVCPAGQREKLELLDGGKAVVSLQEAERTSL